MSYFERTYLRLRKGFVRVEAGDVSLASLAGDRSDDPIVSALINKGAQIRKSYAYKERGEGTRYAGGKILLSTEEYLLVNGEPYLEYFDEDKYWEIYEDHQVVGQFDVKEYKS